MTKQLTKQEFYEKTGFDSEVLAATGAQLAVNLPRMGMTDSEFCTLCSTYAVAKELGVLDNVGPDTLEDERLDILTNLVRQEGVNLKGFLFLDELIQSEEFKRVEVKLYARHGLTPEHI